MQFNVDTSGLTQAAQDMMALPGVFQRARLSALKSTGNMVREELRGHIESGGNGAWVGLRPVTRAYAKKYKMGKAVWMSRRRSTGPMHWLGKFTRYRVRADESIIGFGKSSKGAGGTINPFLMNVLDRTEAGEITRVTPAMRRFFGATRRARSANPGNGFFPIRKDTTELVTPKRPIFRPVMGRIESMILPHFEDKFWRAVTRYQQGVSNKI